MIFALFFRCALLKFSAKSWFDLHFLQAALAVLAVFSYPVLLLLLSHLNFLAGNSNIWIGKIQICGGKYKYLNRKNSEFLAGNSNAKCIMQNANINANIKFSPKPNIFAQSQNLHPNLKFSPKPKIFARTQNFCPNLKFSLQPKIFAQTQNFRPDLKFSPEPKTN